MSEYCAVCLKNPELGMQVRLIPISARGETIMICPMCWEEVGDGRAYLDQYEREEAQRDARRLGFALVTPDGTLKSGRDACWDSGDLEFRRGRS